MTHGSISVRLRRVQSVLSGRACSLPRTTRAAPGRLRRVQRSRSDVKRPAQSREHSALSCALDNNTTERKEFMAEMTQLAQPVRSMDTICLQHLRDQSQKVARHHPCPCLHLPGADGHVLESCAQGVLRLEHFVERARRSATGRCYPSASDSTRSTRLRVHRSIEDSGRVRLLHHAAAVPNSGGGGVWALLVAREHLVSRPAAHAGRA